MNETTNTTTNAHVLPDDAFVLPGLGPDECGPPMTSPFHPVCRRR